MKKAHTDPQGHHTTGSRRRVSASSSGRTQFNRGGAPAGNVNARKSLVWSDDFDLSCPAGLAGFMREVIRRVWCGELGTRAGSTINGTLKLLLEHEALPALERRILELEKVKAN